MVKRNRIENKKRRLRKKLYLGEFALLAQKWRFDYATYPGCEVIDHLHDRLCELHDQGRFIMPFAFSCPEYTSVYLERSVQQHRDTFLEQAVLIKNVFEEEFNVILTRCEPESDEVDPWE